MRGNETGPAVSILDKSRKSRQIISPPPGSCAPRLGGITAAGVGPQDGRPPCWPTETRRITGSAGVSRDGVKIVSHSGGQAGTSTHLIIVPASRIAVAAMCNLQGTPVSQLTNEIVNSLVLETSGK